MKDIAKDRRSTKSESGFTIGGKTIAAIGLTFGSGLLLSVSKPLDLRA